MMRLASIAVALVACGKSQGPTKQQEGSAPPPIADAAIENDATRAKLDGEPTRPPPPPTVKAGPGDCKVEYAPRPTRDPNPMCKIAGGTFMMGEAPEYSHAIQLSPFLIDQFEVTVAQVAFFLEATRADEHCHDPTTSLKCFFLGEQVGTLINKTPDGRYVIREGAERWAYDGATREAAKLYCEWAGKTLPTAARWEFAARHDPATKRDRIYPWGDKFDGKRARCSEKWCGGPKGHLPIEVGSFDGTAGRGDGRSPWGVHDMAGNAAEHLADCLRDPPPCDGPCVDLVLGPRDDGSCDAALAGGSTEGPEQLKVFALRSTMPAGIRCAVP